MSIATITLSNREFRLSCPVENHAALSALAEKLDLEINKIKHSNPSASFELSLIMLALGLLDSKHKQVNLEGGDILKEANKDFQMLLSSVFDELKLVAKNLE